MLSSACAVPAGLRPRSRWSWSGVLVRRRVAGAALLGVWARAWAAPAGLLAGSGVLEVELVFVGSGGSGLCALRLRGGGVLALGGEEVEGSREGRWCGGAWGGV